MTYALNKLLCGTPIGYHIPFPGHRGGSNGSILTSSLHYAAIDCILGRGRHGCVMFTEYVTNALVNCMTHPLYPCQGESLSDVGHTIHVH